MRVINLTWRKSSDYLRDDWGCDPDDPNLLDDPVFTEELSDIPLIANHLGCDMTEMVFLCSEDCEGAYWGVQGTLDNKGTLISSFRIPNGKADLWEMAGERFISDVVDGVGTIWTVDPDAS